MESPYATLVKATQSLQNAELIQEGPDAPGDSVKKYFEINRVQLDLAREALREKPSVPVEFEADWCSNSNAASQALRYLANVLAVEVSMWARGRDYAKAMEVAISGLELSNAMRRGGLQLDATMSNYCGTMIFGQLTRIRANFNETQRTQLGDELARIESERELFESIDERDRKWEAIVGVSEPNDEGIAEIVDGIDTNLEIFKEGEKRGISIEEQRANLRGLLKTIVSTPPDVTRMQSYFADLSWHCVLRMLAVDLGLRAFKEKMGCYPESLEKVTVGSGMACPVDAFTRDSFIYRRKTKRRFFWKIDESFVLYSPGPRQIDRGGVFGSWYQVSSGKADLCLDWASYETSESW